MNPGSGEAVAAGCLCPILDNEHGRGPAPGFNGWIINDECPLHGVSRAVRLTLPFPPRGLSPNARLGWRKKAKLTAVYREDVGWTARERLESLPWRGPEPPVEAAVTFVVPDRRKRDEDNLLAMLKPAWDGLTDAGVLVGDDHERFKVGKVSIEVTGDRCRRCRGNGRIEMLEHCLNCRGTGMAGAPCVIVELRGQ